LENIYPIVWEGKPVGEALVKRKGMFWHIQCSCTGIDENLTVIAVCGICRIELGVCPAGAQGGTIERWIPVKTLPMAEDVSFTLEQRCKEQFIPLAADKPFQAVVQLSAARFEVRFGVPGIVLPDQRSISRPTGQ
jgi:hypothetical protein